MINIVNRGHGEILIPAETPEAQSVLETIDHVGFDPEEVVLVGSAALALYGVKLPPFPDKNSLPRPHDVDFRTTNEFASAINPVTHPHLTLSSQIRYAGETIDNYWTSYLSVDVITKQPWTSLKRSDKRLREGIRNAPRIEGSHIRIVPAAHVEKRLRSRAATDPKAAEDLYGLREKIRED